MLQVLWIWLNNILFLCCWWSTLFGRLALFHIHVAIAVSSYLNSDDTKILNTKLPTGENLHVGVATGSFKSLLALSIIGVLLLVVFTYLSLSNSSFVNQTQLSITTQKLVTNSSQIQFGSAWHYVGNTTAHFNDICPDAGLGVDCVGLTNPPPSIEEWSNGTVTAFVGKIKACVNDSSCQTYSVVIINNSTYCVAPKVEDRPTCPPIIA